jgi:putative secretion ATPase (PEP-CTERM system associated)
MYEEFFGFSGSPFRLAPDPKFFFGSKSHNKAMAYLHYGLRQAEGFIVITGEIGAGKTVLIARLLDQLDRSNVLAANLVTPNLAPKNLLSHILSAFQIEPSGSGDAAEIEAFEDFLFDQMNRGRRVLLIVDEAQNLPTATLEELRVLSNLEYEGTPLFQVFLIGQPDFRETMARADMEQLRQRVIASYHLEPLTRAELEKYVEHRLAHVGWNGDPKFADDAFEAIFQDTGGLPRKIHKLCNRLLLHCSVERSHVIDRSTVAAVLSDLDAETSTEQAPPPVVAPPVIETPAVSAPREIKAASAPEPATPAQAGDVAVPLSVFDRLRSKKRPAPAAAAAEDAADQLRPPKAATLDDVANAIAAARAGAIASAQDHATPAISDDAGIADGASPPPAVTEPPDNWRKTVITSINDTRNELKRAHQSVVKLRKQLTEIDKRRTKRRMQIAASLERAESLLAEFQNAWRQ